MPMLDLKIEGAQVFDGTGAPGARTDVGVRDEHIVAVGDLSREHAGRSLNASGKALAPGFIDMHSHSDWRLWENRRAESKIRQGVTTEVVGNCGFSPAPVSPEFLDELRGFALHVPAGMDFGWRSFGAYLDALDADGLALNVAHLVGHGTLRIAAMGFARRAPTASELATMRALLAAAMEDGAFGLSTGLIYAPGSYSETAEIVDVARAAARHRGFYASHMRGEGATLLTAVAEAITVGREAEMPVQISHLKAAGRPNWGRVADALLDVLVDEGGRGSVILFQMDEEDFRRALAHPAVMVGSDGSSLAPTGPMAASKPHPRSYGTFPRVLGEYARQQRTVTLPHAVHKMTGLPARRLGLADRGVIRVGARADLVVFDPRRVIDVATYDDPHRYPTGIEHVVVSGRFVIRDGEHTGNLPGRVLRHQ